MVLPCEGAGIPPLPKCHTQPCAHRHLVRLDLVAESSCCIFVFFFFFRFGLDHLGAKPGKFGPLKDQQLSSVSSRPGSVQLC